MQKIFNLTNKYIVLATPLILYSLVSSMYLLVSAGGGKLINLLLAIIMFVLMTGAFIAGWFNMIKSTITDPDREDPISLLKDFIPGVGEFFVSSIGALVTMFIIAIISLSCAYHIGINTIGNPNISTEALSNALQNPASLKTFVAGLNIEQLTKINLWNMLILSTITLVYFITFLYIPCLFFKNKNPFIAFFISLKDTFSKKFFKTLGIFALIFILNFIISILSGVFGTNTLIHFLLTLANFYFITLVGVGVFYYYYQNFVKSNIGQNIDIEI